MEEEKSCGAIVYNSENKVLVVKHTAGHWDFPKGHVEENETEIETAKREVKEETNIDINILDMKYRYEIHYMPRRDIYKTVVFYLATNTTDVLKKQDEEILELNWYTYDEALDILTFQDARTLLEKSYKDYMKEKGK